MFHNFQIIQQKGNVFLVKCTCCSKSRWGVYITNERSRMFYYHGNDEAYAQKIFSSLVYRFNSQQQVQ